MIQPVAKLLSYFSFKILCMYIMYFDYICPSLSTSNSHQHLSYYLPINVLLSFKKYYLFILLTFILFLVHCVQLVITCFEI